jgi:hypothetical protein
MKSLPGAYRLLSGKHREKRKEIVFLRQRSKGKKKPDAPPRYRKDMIFSALDCASKILISTLLLPSHTSCAIIPIISP